MGTEGTQNPGGSLTPEEERRLREQVHARLDSQNARESHTVEQNQPEPETGPTATPTKYLTERLRVIREAEDEYYAERGLYRYKNHRGEYEWLTEEERKIRLERRGKRKRRSGSQRRTSESRGIASRLHSKRLDSMLGRVFSVAFAVVIIGLGIALLTNDTDGRTGYVIDIRSEPPGAAIFIDDEATGRRTPAEYHVKGPGTYSVSVARPGFDPRPESHRVVVTNKANRPTVVFTLYSTRNGQTENLDN